eukprot:Em0001g860a
MAAALRYDKLFGQTAAMDKLQNLPWDVLKEDMLEWYVTHQSFHARQQAVPSRLTTTPAGTTPPIDVAQQVVPTTWSELSTRQARIVAGISTLVGATSGQSATKLTGAGSQAVVKSIVPRPGHALHQWPHDL